MITGANAALGQDPSFSQFFSSPLNINPALTARINSKWRVIANLRDQWIGPASPYASATISYDTRALEKQMSENTVFGIGGMLMYNSSMRGIHKASFASLNLSYNVLLAADEVEHRCHAKGRTRRERAASNDRRDGVWGIRPAVYELGSEDEQQNDNEACFHARDILR